MFEHLDNKQRKRLIKVYRKGLGLTQQNMAASLGMSLRAYSDLEMGDTEIKSIHFLAIEMIVIHKVKEPVYERGCDDTN